MHASHHLTLSCLQHPPRPVSSIHEKERNKPDWNQLWKCPGENVSGFSAPRLGTVCLKLFSPVCLVFFSHRSFGRRLNKQSVLNRKCRASHVPSHCGTCAVGISSVVCAVRWFYVSVEKHQLLSLIRFASWNRMVDVYLNVSLIALGP